MQRQASEDRAAKSLPVSTRAANESKSHYNPIYFLTGRRQKMGAGTSSGVSQVLSRRIEKSSKIMDAKRHKLSDDVKKITSAAAKLKLHGKRKDKIQGSEQQQSQQQLTQAFAAKEAQALQREPRASEPSAKALQRIPAQPSRESTKSKPAVAPSTSKGLPHHIVEATKVPERKWTLSDLLQNFGVYVQKHCTHLQTVPSAGEVAMWVRCADRALQLNGWTINSFLLESHVVFTYTLVSLAFQRFQLATLADVKELVLMCLYISYTYNANEISYPLRPFLVKPDRCAFWDKCMRLSLDASTCMLRLNQDRSYYATVLASLKRVTSL